jgi:hypothetical protein
VADYLPQDLNLLAHTCAGHSVTAGAAAGILAKFLGTDEISFTIGTEYPGLPARSYSSLTEAVEDVGLSRIAGGLHFRQSVEDGAALGRQVNHCEESSRVHVA